MEDWEKFNEISLPEKEDFYSHFSMEDITDADYAQPKGVCKGFEVKHLGQYHDLYIEIILKLMFNILKNYTNFIMIYYFYQKE